MTLRITEIFFSLQGESNTVGYPTVFVRLTGCPLRCQYCDTEYAFHGGKKLSVDEILQEVATYQTNYITVTGGEPLAQPGCFALLSALCDRGYQVSLETSGAMDITEVDDRVVVVMDIKTPGSNEKNKNRWENISKLSHRDQIKFVICDREDYHWAKEMIERYQLTDLCEVLFSPSYQQIQYQELADWIIEDQLSVRFQIQMHKEIWGDKPGV